MSWVGLFAYAFMLGLTFNATPGVVTFEALRRGLRGGFGAALRLEVGSLVGDATWGLVALLGLAVIFQHALLATVLSVGGGLLLLRFAYDAFVAAHKAETPTERAPDPRGDLAAGAALSLSNPMNVTFWLGIGGTVVGLGFSQPTAAHLATFYAGYITSSVLWCFALAAIVAWARGWLRPAWYRWVNAACGLVLTGLALTALWGTLAQWV